MDAYQETLTELRIFVEHQESWKTCKEAENTKEDLTLMRKMIEQNINSVHFFHIDDTTVQIIKNTIASKIEHELPFPCIMIDFNQTIKNDTIKSLFLTEGFDNNKVHRGIRITYTLVNDKRIQVETINSLLYNNEKSDNILATKEIVSYVYSFLNFINHPEIQFVTTERNEEQNKKREKRNKPPLPAISHIRLTGKVKEYHAFIENTLIENFHLKRKVHWVRGHWKRFQSSKFIHKKGSQTWVKPFIKGVGIPEFKEYDVKLK